MRTALFVLLAAALIPAAAHAAQGSRAPVWSDLDAVVDEAKWVLLAEVEKVQAVGRLWTRVEALVEETLHGRKAPKRVTYLAGPRAVVQVGDVELVLLSPPEERGLHERVHGRVGERSPYRRQKEAWMREILGFRDLAPAKRGRAAVGFYAEHLLSANPWERERALGEIERLRGVRGRELRAWLPLATIEKALAAATETDRARKRLEALVAWRKQPEPEEPPG